MDQNNRGNNGDSDLSESWTLLDKESSEIDDPAQCECNESSNEDAAGAEVESSRSISNVSDSSYGKLPLECLGTTQNEGAESLDSDGISIISESEEEELKLLPCHSNTIEDRPCSRSSNKYFDETDTASQHSSQDVPVVTNKKYKHRPNSSLNTSLNVLLIVAWAAVIGLGMGHFLGLHEECQSGSNADKKTKIDAQTEELSVGLLKKLELENTALKEQFANLQNMMEEMNRKKAISSCKDPTQVISNGHAAVYVDESSCMEKSSKKQLELKSDDPSHHHHVAVDVKVTGDGDIRHIDESFIPNAPEIIAYHRADSSLDSDDAAERDSMLNKNMIIEKLEQSLDDVTSVFREKLSPDKISMENSREVLSGTISVLSGLVENLKEKVLTIKDSLQTDSLDFEKPFKAITKMEEIIQKTSDKMQKITSDAFKKGKPLHTISNKVTSKLQAINKKLEEKWCQVKQHLSKQNSIWNWLDGQIFETCNDDNRIKGEENKQKDKDTKEDAGGEFIRQGVEEKEKYKASKGNKKNLDENNNVEYKSKQRTESSNVDKTKEKYKKKGWVNPYSFDNRPVKSGNADNGKKREKYVNKNEMKDEKGDYSVGKNEGKYGKVNKSGEWMEAMFNHRAERRRDERRSDWYFTRARSRSRTRESPPSRWYFRRGETKI